MPTRTASFEASTQHPGPVHHNILLKSSAVLRQSDSPTTEEAALRAPCLDQPCRIVYKNIEKTNVSTRNWTLSSNSLSKLTRIQPIYPPLIFLGERLIIILLVMYMNLPFHDGISPTNQENRSRGFKLFVPIRAILTLRILSSLGGSISSIFGFVQLCLTKCHDSELIVSLGLMTHSQWTVSSSPAFVQVMFSIITRELLSFSVKITLMVEMLKYKYVIACSLFVYNLL